MSLDFTNLDIIYAEDDETFQELAVPGLCRLGIPEANIHIGWDGQEALDHLVRLQDGNSSRPLVMMLDIRMPHMDGSQCARKVREMYATLRRKPYLACFSSGFGDGMHDDHDFDVSLPKSYGPAALEDFRKKVEEWVRSSFKGSSAPSPAAAASSTASTDPRDMDIIVADDETICRMTMTTMLEQMGVNDDDVVEAGSLDEMDDALQAAAGSSSAKPLILFLGRPSWLKTAVAVKRRRPFVVSTAMDPGDMMSNGCNGELPRHFSKDQLKGVIAECAGWWAKR